MKYASIVLLLLAAFLCFGCKTAQVQLPSPTPEPTAEPAIETAVPTPVPTPIQVSISTSVPSPEPTEMPQPTKTPTPLPTDTPEPTPAATLAPTAIPEPERLREDLSKRCTFSCTQKNVHLAPLDDDVLQSSVILADKAAMTYAWTEKVPASVLYLFSYVTPDAFHICQYDGTGTVLSEEDVAPQRMCLEVPLQEGCRRVSIQCLGRCKINACQIFGPGNTYPDRVVWWTQGHVDHCDLMLVSTHFDDEILMMGGVLPIYAGEQRKDCQVVYMKGKDPIRKLEAIQGLWEMGVRREAIYLSCTSKSLQRALDNDTAGVHAEDDLQQLVYLIRRYRPLVVVTHDVNGEYGHESHKKTSALVRRAVDLSADPAYDPDSAAKYGVWQVQKEYIHLWKENPLELDVKTPLKNMGNRSAYEVAAKAFTYHKTQQSWSISSTHSKFPIGSYGLYFTAVGPDSGLNDMFENVTAP